MLFWELGKAEIRALTAVVLCASGSGEQHTKNRMIQDCFVKTGTIKEVRNGMSVGHEVGK